MARNYKKNYTGRHNLQYSEQNLKAAINEVKLNRLSYATRCPEQTIGTRARGKKMNVEPGKSVEAADDESSIDSADSDTNSINYESSSTDSLNSGSSSTKSMDKESSSMDNLNSLPSSPSDINNEYHINEFIVARFKSTRRSLLYIGKIIKVNDKTLKASFMRKIIGKNSIYFSFPTVKDEYEVDFEDIVCNVTNGPKDLRRNRYIFPNLSLDTDLIN